MSDHEIRLEHRDYRHHLTEIRPIAEQLRAVVEQLERAGLTNGERQLKAALSALGIRIGDPSSRLLRLLATREGRIRQAMTIEVFGANDLTIDDIVDLMRRSEDWYDRRDWRHGTSREDQLLQGIDGFMLDPPRRYPDTDMEFWQFQPDVVVWGDDARMKDEADGPSENWIIVVDPDDPEEIEGHRTAAYDRRVEEEQRLDQLAGEFLQRVLTSKQVERQTDSDPSRLGVHVRRHLKGLGTDVKITTRSEEGHTLAAWVKKEDAKPGARKTTAKQRQGAAEQAEAARAAAAQEAQQKDLQAQREALQADREAVQAELDAIRAQQAVVREAERVKREAQKAQQVAEWQAEREAWAARRANRPRERVKQYVCPTCDAQIGDPCVSDTGRPTEAHGPRKHLMREAEAVQ